MAINKLTFDGGLNTAKDASSLNYMLGDKDYGILEGVESECARSYSGNTATFSSGVIMIYGRAIRIDNGTQITIPLDVSAYGYVILKIDLSSESVELLYKEGPSYPTLTQNNLQKVSNGVFEFPLAQYQKTITSVNFIPGFIPASLRKSNNVYQKKLTTGNGLSILNDTISINYNIVQEKLTPGDGIVLNGRDISLDPNKTYTKVYEGINAGNLLDYFRNDNDVFLIISDIVNSARFTTIENVSNKKTTCLLVADGNGNVKVTTYTDSLLLCFSNPVLMKKISATSLSFSSVSTFPATYQGANIISNATCDISSESNLVLIADTNFRIFRLT
jgi:hypothetical protein